jgi:RelB Antitoxin alpha helical domain
MRSGLMNALTKNNILDENQNPIAVQIPIGEFEHLEALLETYGLFQLMADPIDGERPSQTAARQNPPSQSFTAAAQKYVGCLDCGPPDLSTHPPTIHDRLRRTMPPEN